MPAIARLLPSAAAAMDEAEVERLLEQTYRLPAELDRPHVRLNFVASVDGAIEVGGRAGPLGNEADRLVFRFLRSLCDVVLVGAGTVRAEGYGPVRLPQPWQRRRTEQGLPALPRLAVVTASGRLDPSSRLFQVPPLVLTGARAAVDHLRDVAEVVPCGDSVVDPALVVEALAERGLIHVLCEGGPQLATELAFAGLVDELCLTLAPQLAGPGRRGLLVGPAWPAARELALTACLESEGSLFLRYVGADG